MAFWNRKKTVEVKSAIGQSDALREFLLYGARDNAQTPASALHLYDQSTAVSIPINRIAESFAILEPVLETDDKKIDDHPLLDLLRNPCPEFSKELFFQALATYYLVTGETFSLIFGPPNRALEIYPISPASVGHQTVGGLVSQFDLMGDLFPSTYRKRNGQYVSEEGLKEIVQIRNFSSASNSVLRGRSKLVAASNAARQQVLGVQHNLSILERGGRLSLVFHFENDMDNATFQKVRDRVREQFGGAQNAGEIGVTAGGKLNIETPGLTNLDMDWTNAQKISFETLLLTYSLPLALFTVEASTLDNYRAGLEAIYDDAIIPLSKVIYGGLAKALFKRFKLDPKTKLTFDKDQVSALVMRRNNEVKLRKDIGIETDNELRGVIGREPYPGGDTMYKPSSMIPIGVDALTEDDDVTDTGDGSDDAEE